MRPVLLASTSASSSPGGERWIEKVSTSTARPTQRSDLAEHERVRHGRVATGQVSDPH